MSCLALLNNCTRWVWGLIAAISVAVTDGLARGFLLLLLLWVLWWVFTYPLGMLVDYLLFRFFMSSEEIRQVEELKISILFGEPAYLDDIHMPTIWMTCGRINGIALLMLSNLMIVYFLLT